MLTSRFIEDIFVEFVDLCESKNIALQHQDLSASTSFYNVILLGNQLTKNQASFLVKILQKYKNFAKMAGLDYTDEIENPLWKNQFRVLDLSKRIFVEKSETGEMFICIKFPFSLKEAFEKEISPTIEDYSSSAWDPERKIRKLKFYNFNLIEIFEFVQKHNFEIDDTFMIALGDVEEIWQNQEEILPYCEKHFGTTVDLINAPTDVVEWFNDHRTCNQSSDLLLAKNMGYLLKDKPTTLVEKIAANSNTHFWLKTLESFFELYNLVNGHVAVIVNKSDNTETWVKEFAETAKKSGVNPADIRVCFRLDKTEDRGFNQWVKDSGYGGKVDGGKIFIFQNKPAKWLFADEIDVKIVLTNSLYPVPSATTQAWMESHTCVCFVGDIKASHIKEKDIVEL
jgi:hypothetical protein